MGSHAIQAKAVDPKLAAELNELFPVNCSKRGYSTVLVNQPFVLDFPELYDMARKHLSAFAQLICRLAELSGGRPLIAPLKSAERAQAKSMFKYRDGGGVAWYRLTDLIRAKLQSLVRGGRGGL